MVFRGFPEYFLSNPDPISTETGHREQSAVDWRYAAVGTLPNVHAQSAHTSSRAESSRQRYGLVSGGFPFAFGKLAAFEVLVHPLLVKVGLTHAHAHAHAHTHTHNV